MTAAAWTAALYQTFTAPFSGPWGLSLLTAWVSHRNFYRQLDALKYKQRKG